jgi:hypothetical protein
MTDDAMTAGPDAFSQRIHACLDDIDAMLPDLARRYDMTVIMSAMAEHAGSALQILRRKKLCDDRQTELAIEHMERAAFTPKESSSEPA